MRPNTAAHQPHASRRPAFDVLLDGRRVAFAASPPATTLLDAVRSVDVLHGVGATPDEFVVDGRIVAARLRLDATGVRHGSVVASVAAGTSTPAIEPAAVIEAVWTAGADAGDVVGLGVGRHVIGRASTAVVRCEDPSLEPHHAVVDIDADGTIWLSQVAGPSPILVDDRPATGRTRLRVDARILIGASLLELRLRTGPSGRAQPPAPLHPSRPGPSNPHGLAGASVRSNAGVADPWRIQLTRGPRPAADAATGTLVAPSAPRSDGAFGSGLLPSILGLVGAVVMAAFFGQMMFLVFGAIGAVVAVGTWTAQRFGLIRSRRRRTREHDRAMRSFESELMRHAESARNGHLATVPTAVSAARVMKPGSTELWAVRSHDPHASVVSIGIGVWAWQPSISGLDGDTPPEVWSMVDRATRLDHVPVPATLAPGSVVAVVGKSGVAVVRSMILQLAAASGPADWQLAVVSASAETWRGFGWLGHVVGGRTDNTGVIAPPEFGAFVNGLDPADRRPLVIVTDGVVCSRPERAHCGG